MLSCLSQATVQSDACLLTLWILQLMLRCLWQTIVPVSNLVSFTDFVVFIGFIHLFFFFGGHPFSNGGRGVRIHFTQLSFVQLETQEILFGIALKKVGALVQAEVQEDITAEETFESKKRKLAELGMALLSDPEANIKSLKEMLQISKDDDQAIVKLALLSMLAVFKDIIPG